MIKGSSTVRHKMLSLQICVYTGSVAGHNLAENFHIHFKSSVSCPMKQCLSANLLRYDLGLIGGALSAMREELKLTGSLSTEVIVGAAKVGAIFGTFLGAAFMLRYGRRSAIAVNGLAFTMGPLIMALSSNVW